MLTYDEHPGVRELYRDFQIARFQIPHTVHRGMIGTEYVITSPQVAPVMSNPLERGEVKLVT